MGLDAFAFCNSSFISLTHPHPHLVNLLGKGNTRTVHRDTDQGLVSMRCNTFVTGRFDSSVYSMIFDLQKYAQNALNGGESEVGCDYVLQQKCWPACTSSRPANH